MNITAVIVAVLLASVITAVGGFWLLPMLRRLHFGQTILEIGPKWHQGKQGTPTMGGLMFIIGIPIAVVVAYLFMHASTVGDPMSAIMRARMFYGLVLALLFGAIGFLDDYLKVVKKQNEGLTEKQKMALQILFGAVYLLLLHISGTQSTMVTIPYIGTYDFGVFYYVFAMFAIIALSNAVNFTDGLDGLLSSVTLVLSIGYLIFCYLLGMGEMGIMAGALGGGCIGFLFWNHYPAKVFMGDTGSLFKQPSSASYGSFLLTIIGFNIAIFTNPIFTAIILLFTPIIFAAIPTQSASFAFNVSSKSCTACISFFVAGTAFFLRNKTSLIIGRIINYPPRNSDVTSPAKAQLSL